MSKLVKPPIGPEQLIAEMQLERLLKEASYRLLTLEEIKQYDLLCKNLKLAKGEATEILEASYQKQKEEFSSLPDEVLLSIAEGTLNVIEDGKE